MSHSLAQSLHGPPDSTTKQNAKTYFKVIQITHHHSIISRAIDTGFFPQGMRQHAIKLTQFIRPAMPTSQTQQLLDQNTTDWMHHNLQILYEHYSTQLTTLLQSIISTPFNHIAFQIANGWAKKRFHRLSPITLTTAQQFLCSSSTTSLQSLSIILPASNPQSTPHLDDLDEFSLLHPPARTKSLSNSPLKTSPPSISGVRVS